jgi:hypothetical protein
MMTAPAATAAGVGGKAIAADVPPATPEKQKRLARLLMERPENLAGTSDVPARGKPLQHVIARLVEPVVVGDDPERAQAHLEEQCRALVEDALAMQEERFNFNQDLREYEAAQGFTPITN